MDHDLIRSQMPALVSGHVPRNARSFTFAIYDGLPQLSMLGFRLDPKPFEGKVIASNDEAIVVKTGRTTFAVLNRNLVTEQPTEGSKVRVTPYARHRFDGQRADTPKEEVSHSAEGTSYVMRTYVLGSAPAKLPVAMPKCPELADLIEQLEKLPAPDGFRTITHLLVDARARDFSLVDPLPVDIIRTPPAINFSVATEKFTGQVSVIYDRASDVYVVELWRDGELLERLDEVYFDDLGSTLERLIDDGRWREIDVEVLR
ncbi:GTPase [Pseudomonas sp. SBT1-2]|uniref:GTPase n=1 Tax=Pseudomonas sp. SBT1-2 TaxID=3027852 RepID=UPI00235E0D8B|nr:GTPase [Pseudomonas sp. SBT1-2]